MGPVAMEAASLDLVDVGSMAAVAAVAAVVRTKVAEESAAVAKAEE